MPKRVTVYDIAKKLDISPSTVSRVLNNSNLISNERARQIHKIAEEMGYRPRAIKKQVNRAILNIHLFLPTADSTMAIFSTMFLNSLIPFRKDSEESASM